MRDRLPTTGRTAWLVLTNVLRAALDGDEADLRAHVSLLTATDVARLRNAMAAITDLTDRHVTALRRSR
jgi:hypothetical protein